MMSSNYDTGRMMGRGVCCHRSADRVTGIEAFPGILLQFTY